ncbi:hypothetical protein CAL29_11495 [Bordetella genomosp. 10]|uniref:Uncharacterized protein n=1 Tax=Bordetella genomosp. 10 TaxID=1416804 RepID=A0A261S9Z8_9BORD|nr:hypothetical protein [Bordetella genomosp. 10]OZI34166.1 hypothetical protein CAL29_11495 [Bordetella genomosp. 10]
MKKTLATSLILSFALIGAAQAAPGSDTDNMPFPGVYGQANAGPEGSSPLAMSDVPQVPQDQATQMAASNPDNVPFQGS